MMQHQLCISIIRMTIIGAEIHAQIGIPMCVGWNLIPTELEVLGNAIMVEGTVVVGEHVQALVSELTFS